MDKKRRSIQIRVTKEQYERLRNKAFSQGYKTLTSFILQQALENDLLFERRFNEMYQAICRSGTSNKKP